LPALGRGRACVPASSGEESVPSQRFAVEFDHRVVGVAVRVPGGFMFFASVDEFDEMDGQLFPRARAIERRLETVARRAQMRAANRNLTLAIQ
jgi:hypothetical protein